MRALTDSGRLERFMIAIGSQAREEARVYFTGGATALLFGWRSSTVDVDVKFVPEHDEILRAIPAIKERLDINVELASPSDFIPEIEGWRERSPFITRKGSLSFFHYDFYAQALSKIERGHARDEQDVRELFARGLIEPAKLLGLFASIEPSIYRYPAIDPQTFRSAVEKAVARLSL